MAETKDDANVVAYKTEIDRTMYIVTADQKVYTFSETPIWLGTRNPETGHIVWRDGWRADMEAAFKEWSDANPDVYETYPAIQDDAADSSDEGA
jgi:hypothetical protein